MGPGFGVWKRVEVSDWGMGGGWMEEESVMGDGMGDGVLG
jgi:hypothetical protein